MERHTDKSSIEAGCIALSVVDSATRSELEIWQKDFEFYRAVE